MSRNGWIHPSSFILHPSDEGSGFVQKGWSILFGAVMLACTLLWAVAPFVSGWWLPHAASTWAGWVDGLYYMVLAICGFFFLLTEGILVYNLWRAAATPGRRSDFVHGHHRLEVFWTSVTAVILLIIAFAQVGTWGQIKYWWGFPMFAQKPGEGFQVKDRFEKHTDKAPEGYVQMEVFARQFEWRVRYASQERMASFESEPNSPGHDSPANFSATPHIDDVHVVNEIHVWKGAAVLVHLKTRDVIHSFYLPNMRLKQDALPGRTIPVWFMPTEANTVRDGNVWHDGLGRDAEGKPKNLDFVWELACAELCGWGHYKMQGRLYVHETRADYEAWLAEAAKHQNATQPEAR
jgi:cytochrome c oxidase subunit 2